MNSLIKILDCGSCSQPSNYNHVNFFVTKFSDLNEKVIPFFDKYSIIGVKLLDFNDFKQVAELMKNNAHLTQEGLDKIRKIKTNMNRGRKYFNL